MYCPMLYPMIMILIITIIVMTTEMTVVYVTKLDILIQFTEGIVCNLHILNIYLKNIVRHMYTYTYLPTHDICTYAQCTCMYKYLPL